MSDRSRARFRHSNARFDNRRDAHRTKAGFFYLRVVVCLMIIAVAAVLKWMNAPVVEQITQTVNDGLGIDEAVDAISRAAGGDSALMEVFDQKEDGDDEAANEKDDGGEDIEDNAEAAFGQDFYIEDETKAIEEEMNKAREQMAAEAARMSIELLSFQMSEEELADDTEAVPFRIPPPSTCSYKKEEITFKYKAPLYGVITSKFGYRDHPIIEDASFHTGLDIAAKSGSTISAFAAGTVVETGKNATYGNYLKIDHGSGFTSFYGHNSKVVVKKGEKVSLGQKVAEVGSTGMSTGPHLHFEVRKNNIRLDPELYISPEQV